MQIFSCCIHSTRIYSRNILCIAIKWHRHKSRLRCTLCQWEPVLRSSRWFMFLKMLLNGLIIATTTFPSTCTSDHEERFHSLQIEKVSSFQWKLQIVFNFSYIVFSSYSQNNGTNHMHSNLHPAKMSFYRKKQTFNGNKTISNSSLKKKKKLVS